MRFVPRLGDAGGDGEASTEDAGTEFGEGEHEVIVLVSSVYVVEVGPDEPSDRAAEVVPRVEGEEHEIIESPFELKIGDALGVGERPRGVLPAFHVELAESAVEPLVVGQTKVSGTRTCEHLAVVVRVPEQRPGMGVSFGHESDHELSLDVVEAKGNVEGDLWGCGHHQSPAAFFADSIRSMVTRYMVEPLPMDTQHSPEASMAHPVEQQPQ
jgi:hypothetical protein